MYLTNYSMALKFVLKKKKSLAMLMDHFSLSSHMSKPIALSGITSAINM